MTLTAALFTGFVIGLILSTPAVFVELLRPETKNLPILIDVEILRGRRTTRGEEMVLSHLLQLFMSTIFGAGYVLLARIPLVPFIFSGPTISLYVLIFYLSIGGVLFPLLGLGYFGRNEGRYVPLELLMAHALYGFCFYVAANLFFLR